MVDKINDSVYESATSVTKELLRHWERGALLRRLFFCRREAVETIIYLVEILQRKRCPRFHLKFSKDDLSKLVDSPNDPDIPDLIRYGCKMATGSGKTVVMAMLITWAFCNRGKVPSDKR